MNSYYRRPPSGMPAEDSTASPPASEEAGKLLRRLIPYPAAAEAIPSVAMTALSPGGNRAQAGTVSQGLPPAPSREAAASIVSEAASVLDEEMAKGVLAARGAGQGSRYGTSDPSRIWLRQLHDLVDNVADIWPSLQGTSGLQPALSQLAASNVSPESLPELKPRSPARPGDRAIIQMTLCNKESRPVRLVPAATDLLGSKGDRIACHLLQFAPSEIRLGPGEQKELEIVATVPIEALPGCYAGLLVVTGIEYLRALITIEVV